MKARKGFILATTLAIITILTVAGVIGTYIVMKETRLTVDTSDSIKALKAAESGVEIALAKLKKRGITSFPYTFSGTISEANYNVTVSEESGGYSIVSMGKKNEAERTIKVFVQKVGTSFYPFAINGKLEIGKFQNTGQGIWTDAQLVAKDINIDNDTLSVFESANFTVEETLQELNLPKVADIDTSSLNCTSDISKDYALKANSNSIELVDLDTNSSIIVSDGDIICGRNIKVEGNLRIDSSLVIKAEETLEFTKDSRISLTGANSGFNLLLYAGKGIVQSDSSTWGNGNAEETNNKTLIFISGNQNKESISNILILTPEEINVDKYLVKETGKTENDVNILIWADKGITSSNGGFFITGNSETVRNFGVIVADGNATFGSWRFMGEQSRSGLTYEEITNYCDDTTIPKPYRDVFCQLKDQIDGGSGSSGSSIVINKWKTY